MPFRLILDFFYTLFQTFFERHSDRRRIGATNLLLSSFIGSRPSLDIISDCSGPFLDAIWTVLDFF
uniref:Uncharacterized protein n=1 Tax=Rhizophagus irregularis (strain DAOM 181602 / DAOM 197198 / MUCL 43194) TaxID=747089 RepID=U9V1X8_RHIID